MLPRVSLFRQEKSPAAKTEVLDNNGQLFKRIVETSKHNANLRVLACLTVASLTAGCTSAAEHTNSEKHQTVKPTKSNKQASTVSPGCPITSTEVSIAFGYTTQESQGCSFATFLPDGALNANYPSLLVTTFPSSDPTSPQTLAAEAAAYQGNYSITEEPQWGEGEFLVAELGTATASGDIVANGYLSHYQFQLLVPQSMVSNLSTMATELGSDIAQRDS